MRTVVLGLGNPVLRDDAVGLAVADRLTELLKESPVPGLDVLVSTRAGFELIDMLTGYGRAIIVDALDLPEPQPGNVREMALENFAGSSRLNNPHGLNVATAFELAERLGVSMPGEVLIYGIECADLQTLVEELTPDVEKVVEPLARQIHEKMAKLNAGFIEDGDDEFKHRRAFYSP